MEKIKSIGRPVHAIILKKKTMQIVNMNAIFLIFIGTLVRFSYFPERSQIIEQTRKDEETGEDLVIYQTYVENETLGFKFSTLLLLPALIVLYVLVELEVSKDSLCKNFNFLELPIGKGLYLLLLAIVLLEKTNTVEIIFGIAIFVISVLNIVVGILKRNEKPGEQCDEEAPLAANHTHLTRADSLLGQNTTNDSILKNKDTNNKARAQEVVDKTNTSIRQVQKGSASKSSDKKSGSGSVTVSATPTKAAQSKKDDPQENVPQTQPLKKEQKQTPQKEVKFADQQEQRQPALNASPPEPTINHAEITMQEKQQQDSQGSGDTEELTQMAAVLYMELKKHIRKKDYQQFNKTVQQAKQISKKQNLSDLVETCANHKESDGKNILHTAAIYAAQNDDTRFFISLLGLSFPLYHEDDDKNFPAFLIADVSTDSKFSSAFNALLEVSFDVNRESSGEETFMTKVCKSLQVSPNRIQGIIQTKPVLKEETVKEIDASVAVSKARKNPGTKKALKILKEYASTNFPEN